MNFDFLNDIKNINCENVVSGVFETIESLIEKINEVKKLDKNKKGELYYVYSYTPEKVYITKQGSSKVELLEGVSDEFKNNLAEGFILREKDGKYTVDEELTEKSMNFELDFDNYKE